MHEAVRLKQIQAQYNYLNYDAKVYNSSLPSACDKNFVTITNYHRLLLYNIYLFIYYYAIWQQSTYIKTIQIHSDVKRGQNAEATAESRTTRSSPRTVFKVEDRTTRSSSRTVFKIEDRTTRSRTEQQGRARGQSSRSRTEPRGRVRGQSSKPRTEPRGRGQNSKVELKGSLQGRGQNHEVEFEDSHQSRGQNHEVEDRTMRPRKVFKVEARTTRPRTEQRGRGQSSRSRSVLKAGDNLQGRGRPHVDISNT